MPPSEVYRSDSSIVTMNNQTRYTKQKGPVGEAANWRSSAATSFVYLRSLTGYPIPSS